MSLNIQASIGREPGEPTLVLMKLDRDQCRAFETLRTQLVNERVLPSACFIAITVSGMTMLVIPTVVGVNEVIARLWKACASRLSWFVHSVSMPADEYKTHLQMAHRMQQARR